MSKRNFGTITLYVMCVSCIAMNNARAQGSFVGADGCTVLGDLIDNELSQKRWFGEGGSGLLLSNSGQLDVTTCNQTARAVTGAFTSALAGMNIDVSWGYYPGHKSDTCFSADLSQCYPDRYPLIGVAISDQMVVLDIWRVVRQAVIGSMPLGSASDTSRFSVSDFGTTLSRALRKNTLRATLNYQHDILRTEN